MSSYALFNSPANAAAHAALSKPGEPSDLVFHERLESHKIKKVCKEIGLMPLYAMVDAELINARMRKSKVWVGVGTTHLVIVGEKGELVKAMRLQEVLTITCDLNRNWCLITPTSVSGDPMWLWEWACSGSAATKFFGALIQCQRPVSQGRLASIVFRPIKKDELRLKPMKTTLKIKSRMLEITSTKPQAIELYEDAAFEYHESRQVEELNNLFNQAKESHSLAIELNQRRTERTVVTVVLASVVAAFEGKFKSCVAKYLVESEKLALEEQRIAFETQRVQTAVHAVSGHSKASITAISQVSYKEAQLRGIVPFKNLTKQSVAVVDPVEGGWVDPEGVIDLKADFATVAKPQPTVRHTDIPRSVSSPAGLRPKAATRLNDPTILRISHPSWAPDRLNPTTAATIYALFADSGAPVQSHRWVNEALLELRLSKHTPYPKAMAAAISHGYLCCDPLSNHLLLDI